MVKMKCPYNDFDCTEVDTSGMDKVECKDCKHYPDIDKLAKDEEED